MSDKILEDVTKQAKELREVAVESAKARLLEDLSPKIKKLLDKEINNESRKILDEQAEEGPPQEPTDPTEKQDEAEVDLDDLAAELEKDEATDEEGGSESEGELADAVEDLKNEVEKVKDDVEVIADKTGVDIEGGEKEEEAGEPKAEKETEETKETEEEEVKEAVDISIKDNDVKIDVTGDSLDIAAPPMPTTDEDEYVDIIDDTEEEEPAVAAESRNIRGGRKMAKTLGSKLREQSFAEPVVLADDEDPEDGMVDIVDDEAWSDEDAPKKVDWSKHVPRLEGRQLIRKLKSENVRLHETLNKVNGILSETNLLNKKLVLVTKLFSKYSLSKDGKMKVLEAFDKATNVRESLVTYKKICEKLVPKAKETPKPTVTKPSLKAEAVEKDVKKGLLKEEGKEPATKTEALLEVARPSGTLPADRILEVKRLQQLAGIDN